jgi:hypothetical protein
MLTLYPRSKSMRPTRVRSRKRFRCRIRVIATRNPESSRWKAQPALMVNGPAALLGFTKDVAEQHLWHDFVVERRKLGKTLRMLKLLIAAGRIEVEVEGKPLKPKEAKAA